MKWLSAKIAASLILTATVLLIGGATIHYALEQKRQTERAVALTGGDPERALVSIAQYGCAACHQIPGAQMPGGRAASPLSGVAERLHLGGAVANTPKNMIRWIVNPKDLDANSAMPRTGIGEAEARNIAAYLYRMR